VHPTLGNAPSSRAQAVALPPKRSRELEQGQAAQNDPQDHDGLSCPAQMCPPPPLGQCDPKVCPWGVPPQSCLSSRSVSWDFAPLCPAPLCLAGEGLWDSTDIHTSGRTLAPSRKFLLCFSVSSSGTVFWLVAVPLESRGFWAPAKVVSGCSRDCGQFPCQ
jgi:hypothetical protein